MKEFKYQNKVKVKEIHFHLPRRGESKWLWCLLHRMHRYSAHMNVIAKNIHNHVTALDSAFSMKLLRAIEQFYSGGPLVTSENVYR